MRRTCNATLAMRRIAERMDFEVVRASARTYTIPGFIEYPINAKRCLARMVRFAQFSETFGGPGMNRSEVRDTIRLTRIDSRGVPGHEVDELSMVLTRG